MKPQKPFAWSYSSLTGFETCPYRHYRTKVLKDVSDPPGEAAMWGQRVHKALELRVGSGTPLPESLVNYEPYAAKFASAPGQVLVEHQITLNKSLRPTTWFGKDAWCRGVIDVAVVKDGKAVVADYKTGKRKPDNDQLNLFAALGFIQFPEVQRIDTMFIWLKDKKVDTTSFTRANVLDIWSSFLPRVKRMEKAYTGGEDAHQKKPSGLCRSWCPVKDCEYNGAKGR